MTRKESEEILKKMLRTRGLKATPSRVAILETFPNGCNPMSAEKVHSKIKRGIDPVTIYRTLAAFEKSGILRRVGLEKDSVYFELNTDHHHHIICTNCEKVSEFKNEDHEKIIAKALRQVRNFKTVSHHSFELFGLCNSCLQ